MVVAATRLAWLIVLAPALAHAADTPTAKRLGWPSIDASAELSTYTDTNQVTVVTPTARVAARDEQAGWRVGGRYLVDVVSAASPDIVATASPRWNEKRHVVALDGELSRGDVKAAGATSMSVEPDYLSLTAGITPSMQLDHDHVTVAAGYSLGHDTIGRAGTPFSVFHRTLLRHAFTSGASFVIDSRTLLWLGGDAVLERGNQAKPYRYVPMFAADVAARLPAGASADLVNDARLQERPLEKLPEGRDRFAVTSRLLHRFSKATLRIEERLYGDTWSQRASTTDLRWMQDLGTRLTLGPSLRFHVQNAVSFWQRAYVPTEVPGGVRIPEFRTGDRELGSLWTLTLGADARIALTERFAKRRASLLVRVAGSHTSFLDALFVSDRQALFTALGFESQLD